MQEKQRGGEGCWGIRPRKKRRITQERKKEKECRVLCSQKGEGRSNSPIPVEISEKKSHKGFYLCGTKGKFGLTSLANPCCPSKIPYPSLLLPSSSKLLPQPPTPIIRVEPRKKNPHVIFNPSPTTATRICKNGMAHRTTMGLFKTFSLTFFARCVMMDLLARLRGSPPFA